MSRAPADAHLLIVEPDERLRALLRQYLSRHGYMVTAARDEGHALRLLQGLDFDLIVAGGGAQPVAHLGAASGAPILALAASDQATAPLIEAGACDALQRPFEPPELVARLDAMLEREAPGTGAEAPLRLGPLSYDRISGALMRGGDYVSLTAAEVRLMRLLAECPGEPVSRARLADLPEGADTPAQARAVDVQITRLRRKIEPDPRSPRYVQTVRGTGYMLVPD